MSTVVLNEFGKAAWTDYVDYWRDDDTNWLQARSILRYADSAGHGATGEIGQIVYNKNLDLLEMYSKDGAWKRYGPMPYFMTPSQDSATGVNLKHTSAPGGVLFTSPTYTPAPQANALLAQVPLWSAGLAVLLDTAGITIKVGTKTVKIDTDATSLKIDSPVSATSFNGAISGPSASISGPLTVAGLLTASGDVSVTGKISVTAINSNISGVVFTDQSVDADKGVTVLGGVHYGTASSARMAAGTFAAPGASYVDVAAADIVLHATNINLDGQPFIVAKAINYRPTLGGTNYPISPAVYAAADPGAANFPEGTIWIS